MAEPEMTEQEILIAIHRAIDEAAAQHPAARAIAARYIPAYERPTAVGWTQSLDKALGLDKEAKKAALARTKARAKAQADAAAARRAKAEAEAEPARDGEPPKADPPRRMAPP